jgi:hypothetical protein
MKTGEEYLHGGHGVKKSHSLQGDFLNPVFPVFPVEIPVSIPELGE